MFSSSTAGSDTFVRGTRSSFAADAGIAAPLALVVVGTVCPTLRRLDPAISSSSSSLNAATVSSVFADATCVSAAVRESLLPCMCPACDTASAVLPEHPLPFTADRLEGVRPAPSSGASHSLRAPAPILASPLACAATPDATLSCIALSTWTISADPGRLGSSLIVPGLATSDGCAGGRIVALSPSPIFPSYSAQIALFPALAAKSSKAARFYQQGWTAGSMRTSSACHHDSHSQSRGTPNV